MPHLHRRHLLFAGLMIAGTGAPAATAQEAPAALAQAPLPAPTVPGAITEGDVPGGPTLTRHPRPSHRPARAPAATAMA